MECTTSPQPLVPLHRQQLAQVSIELRKRTGIGAEEREMAVDGFDRAELGVGNESPLGLAIGRWEEHITRHRHDERLRFNAL